MVSEGSLDSLAAGLPIAPVIAARVDRIRHAALTFDHKNRPIPLIQRSPSGRWPGPHRCPAGSSPTRSGRSLGEPQCSAAALTPIVSLGRHRGCCFALGLWGWR